MQDETKKTKKKLSHKSKNVIAALSVIGFAIFGVWLVGFSMASTTTTTTPTAQCGARVTNYTYKVPFGNAVWNQPVCNLPKYSKSADYASRFYNFGVMNMGNPEAEALKGKISTSIGTPEPTLLDPEGLSGLFSRNVYLASQATTTTKVQTSVYPSNLDGDKWEGSKDPDRQKYLPDTAIPWNPDWRTGEGGDNEIVILDDVTGKGLIYGVSGYKRNLAAVTQCGPFGRERICAYNVNIGRDMKGNLIDYRTYEGPTGDRGVGISYYATLVTPDEVLAGEIRHALGVSLPNTAVGPICTPAQLGTAAEGKTCGTALAPANKFEWGGVTRPSFMPEPFNSFYTQDKLIPEGMRFALNIDDAYIENWINSRSDLKSNATLAQTARTFARALRDYGMIVVDTNGNRPAIQMSGAANPNARTKWEKAGLNATNDNKLLDGLMTASNLYVVEPPTQTCLDGTKTKYYCKWTSASYGTTPTTAQPAPTPEPTPANTPPTVNLGALNTAGYVSPATINLTATASDPDGIAKVEFFNGTTKLGEDPTSPFTYAWTGVKEGTYAISARATDKKGLSTTTTKVYIPVKATATSSPPPTTTLPALPTKVSIPTAVPVEVRFNPAKFEFHQATILRWGESSSSKGIAKYIVNKNGKKVYEGLTREFVDFEINDGQRYKYEIFAQDKANYYSSPATYDRTVKCTWWGLVCTY